jgi:dipeptidase E
LEHAADPIRAFLGKSVRTIAFVPYAAVRISVAQYVDLVRGHFQTWGYRIQSVHEGNDPSAIVSSADAIVVGGGNTFHLLYRVYQHGLLETLRARARNGVPFIGWSAGSNIACPTIRTTNDMPIIAPPKLEALNLVPFQINPHYLDTHPAGHGGETREQRLLEFIEVNPDVFVVGLREGSMLKIEDSSIELIGEKTMRVFKKGRNPTEYGASDVLDFLLD